MTDQPKDFQKDRFESCIKLADYFRELWESRREYEWKISLGLWTLLGAGAVTLRGKGGINGGVISIPVIVFYFGWLWPMWNRSLREKESGIHFRRQAEEVLGNADHLPTKFPDEPHPLRWRIQKFICDWSMFFQLATTVAFTFALYHFNHIPPEPPPAPAQIHVQVEREQGGNTPQVKPEVLPQNQIQQPTKSTKRRRE